MGLDASSVFHDVSDSSVESSEDHLASSGPWHVQVKDLGHQCHRMAHRVPDCH